MELGPIFLRSAEHAADVQAGLQDSNKTYKPEKHFKLSRPEFVTLHRHGLLTRLPAAGWYLFRDMPVWIA